MPICPEFSSLRYKVSFNEHKKSIWLSILRLLNSPSSNKDLR